MKLSTILIFNIVFIFYSKMLHADEANVAQVILLRGHVIAKFGNDDIFVVKENQSLPEGTTLQTSEKSFVKLIFIDKSQMSLGPNSQMIINTFPKQKAGIITLVKGQIRSQVTKDYMKIDDLSKSKLYIKTKTAAMGIRGTDFQVNYNPENLNTSLITFEGKVAMSNIDKNERSADFDQSRLEGVVSSVKAVMVEHGQISAVNLNVSERAMAPTLLGAVQIYALKKNETGLKDSGEENGKQYRNPLPPGAQSNIFSKSSANKDQENEQLVKNNSSGFFNTKTGEYKLPAGSIVDLKTVNIIPPPVNAVFDPNSKTYIVPETYGKINKANGDYIPPVGLKLGDNGKFVVIDAAALAKSQAVNKEEKKESNTTKSPSETPAEVRTPSSLNQDSAHVEVPKIYDAHPEIAAFTTSFGVGSNSAGAIVLTDAQRAAAASVLTTNSTVKQGAADMGQTFSRKNLKFNLNAK